MSIFAQITNMQKILGIEDPPELGQSHIERLQYLNSLEAQAREKNLLHDDDKKMWVLVTDDSMGYIGTIYGDRTWEQVSYAFLDGYDTGDMEYGEGDTCEIIDLEAEEVVYTFELTADGHGGIEGDIGLYPHEVEWETA